MTTALYETDFYQWTVKQAELLRGEDYAELDIDNLIEEIESMGRSDRREVGSRLTPMMEHMLKLVHEPKSRAKNGWKRTIATQRIELAKLLRDNYTLRSQIADFIEDAYPDARQLAAVGLDCSVVVFPVACPWTAGQLQNIEWLP